MHSKPKRWRNCWVSINATGTHPMSTLPTLPRALDPGEAFFCLSDLVSSMNFVVLAERSQPLDTRQLPQALAALQQENQLLRARICWHEANGLQFEPAPDAAIKLQCQAAQSDTWVETISAELSSPFVLESAPLMRCTCLSIDKPDPLGGPCSVLALTFHHSIADGRAGMALLRRLLALLAGKASPFDLSAAAVPGDLLPPMKALMPPDRRWAELPEAAQQLKAALIADYRRFGAPATLPWLDSGAPGMAPKIRRLRLDAGQTRRLLARARDKGTTVHGVLCAAQLLAQAQLHDTTTPRTTLLSSPVDMRDHLQPVAPELPLGLFVSIVSATFAVAPDTALWPLAQDILRQTRVQIHRGEGHLFFNMFGLDGSPVLPERVAPFHKKLLASLHNTMVSNVGALPSVPEDDAVQAMSFALCPMPYQALFTAASSYNGQLILNIGFDAVRIKADTADQLISSMAQLLQDAAA